MNHRFTILCLVLAVLHAQNLHINSFEIRRKEKDRSASFIEIQNTHDILDLRWNFQLNSQTEANSWSKLIVSGKAYLLVENGIQIKGYRFLKNPLHYKNSTAQFQLYQTLIEEILVAHSINTKLIFGDKYSIFLQKGVNNKWEITRLSIEYTFNQIDKFDVNPDIYDIQVHSNKTTNIQQSYAIRKISGKGLHQKINLTLALDFQASLQLDQTCKVVIEQILPQSTYIDVDQLRSVNRFQVINVQLPEPASKQYYYQYTIPFSKFTEVTSRRYNYLYPIHFRYPSPSHLNYTIVALHPSDKIQLVCNNNTKSINIPEDPFNTRGQASIFNGSSHDSKIVSMITFILMIVAATIIIKQLRKI